MVEHQRPFTGTGDDGTTTTAKGRVSKDSLVIEALGQLDELVATLGFAKVALMRYPDIQSLVGELQRTLFRFAAVIHKMPGYDIEVKDIKWIEDLTIEYNSKLPPLKKFIIPGGSEAASRLHLARTVCRRAERSVVALAEPYKPSKECLTFINRMSSLLFVIARYVNQLESVEDEKL
jgi:cob(I)alamin adenosyltransferase